MDINKIYKEFQKILRDIPVLIIDSGNSIAVDSRLGLTGLTNHCQS